MKALKVLLSLAVTFGMFVGFLEALVVLGLLQIPGLLSWRTANADMDASLLHWIDGLDGRPFFAFVNYLDVHGPFIPPEQFRGTFSSDQPPSAQIGMDLGALAGGMALPPTEVIQDRLNRYDESILAWDAAFGDLQHDLETRGLLENTLIIVTSDHGESFGERGLFNHGHSLYREQVDIPLVLSWPAGIRQPRKDSNPVGLDQVPATLLDAAGLPQGGFPGLSLLNTHEAPPAEVLVEVARRSITSFAWPSSQGWVAGVISPDWRFLLREDGTTELFDAKNDPLELHNLAVGDSAPHSVIDSLRQRLMASGVADGLSR